MTSFLLDANLSQKTARYLEMQLGLDVVSIQRQRLGKIPDRDVIQMARSSRRVIVTLDRDFAEFFFRTRNPRVGIIYLDLPNELRHIPEINQLLANFFESHASSIDLERSLVVLTETEVQIHQEWI